MKLRSKSTHSQHTCRKTTHKKTRRKRRKPLPQEKEARDQTRRGGKSNQARGDARKATNEKGAQTAVRTPFKKDSFVMVLRIILSDFASEGEGATGASRTVLRGFRSPRQIRFRHRRGSRHREILDHRNARHRDDSDHREQRDV